MAKRKSIGKAQRFRVFARDAFTCQYCGRKPPEVVLHLDHITPVVEGGDNDDTNLLTACADCNLGKSKHTIEALSLRARINEERFEEMQEARAQLEAYQEFLREESARKNSDVLEVERVLIDRFDHRLSDTGRESVVKFLEKLPVVVVVAAMNTACKKIGRPGDAFKYFCGICRNKIRYSNDPQAETRDRQFYAFESDYRDFSGYPDRRELKQWWERHVWARSARDDKDALLIGRAMLAALRQQWNVTKCGGYFRCLADEVEPDDLWIPEYETERAKGF